MWDQLETIVIWWLDHWFLILCSRCEFSRKQKSKIWWHKNCGMVWLCLICELLSSYFQDQLHGGTCLARVHFLFFSIKRGTVFMMSSTMHYTCLQTLWLFKNWENGPCFFTMVLTNKENWMKVENMLDRVCSNLVIIEKVVLIFTRSFGKFSLI